MKTFMAKASKRMATSRTWSYHFCGHISTRHPYRGINIRLCFQPACRKPHVNLLHCTRLHKRQHQVGKREESEMAFADFWR
eukprot:6186651-Pleurochrysis_carterae.AAC.1